MPKSNPYDATYVMKRDGCSFQDAVLYVSNLKLKTAPTKGIKIKKSNPYDPEYIMKRDKCSFEDALLTKNLFKNNKATTLSNFIKKHGESDGTKKYEEWKNKSLKKGWDIKECKSKFSPKFYTKLGHSIEQANKLALEYQHKNSPLHIQYYIERGYDTSYANEKIKEFHAKKIGRDCYKEFLIKNGISEHDAECIIKKSRGYYTRERLGDEKFDIVSSKIRKSLEDANKWIPLENLSEYQLYRRKVWYYTKKNDLTSLENYEKRGLAGELGAYHLDHKFSISRGFIENVNPKLLGSLKNLHFIPWLENVNKQGQCSITIKELKDEN